MKSRTSTVTGAGGAEGVVAEFEAQLANRQVRNSSPQRRTLPFYGAVTWISRAVETLLVSTLSATTPSLSACPIT